jgi:hypothetical protein
MSVEALGYLTQNPYNYPSGKLPRNIDLLGDIVFPESPPFTTRCFEREDETDDADFYNQPRFLTHIDDEAIAALTKLYGTALPDPDSKVGFNHLDLCSSWVSFLPTDYKPNRCVGLGMNQPELDRNMQLTERLVLDLNMNPKLPFDDSSFDAVTNVVSVDYMSQPIVLFEEVSGKTCFYLAVMNYLTVLLLRCELLSTANFIWQMRRVMRPGAIAVMSFSNRMFWTKAIKVH